jgi:hypothetical protein
MHEEGHILVAGGATHCFGHPQDELWLEKIVKAHILKTSAADWAAPVDPRSMVVIDAHSVHREPSLIRLFQSAVNSAEPAAGTLPPT